MGLAGDAVDREAVGPVRRDLEHEHIGGEREHIRELVTGLEEAIEHHDAVVLGPDRKLVLGQNHPLGLDPAQLGRLQLGPVGHHRSGPRDRDRVSGAYVRRAADDLRRLAIADVDPAEAEAVGVRVRARLEHPTHNEPLERAHAVVLDALDLGPGHGQALGERARVFRRSAVVVKPFERYAHQPNCSRKRMSLS